MRDNIEGHVRTIVARVLKWPLEDIAPRTMLHGVVYADQLLSIGHFVEIGFDIALTGPRDWPTVADLVLATEAAIAADRARGQVAA